VSCSSIRPEAVSDVLLDDFIELKSVPAVRQKRCRVLRREIWEMFADALVRPVSSHDLFHLCQNPLPQKQLEFILCFPE
jgi:hypothetical protein